MFFCRKKEKAVTMVELAIVSIVFSLFLVAVYSILDAGLKSWNMGQTRTDLQNSGQVVIRRMVRELTMASQRGLVMAPAYDRTGAGGEGVVHEYIAFETPIKDAAFAYQEDNFGTPLWQGYILYYVLPQGDPGVNSPQTLYRRYIPHTTERTMPTPILNITSKLIEGPCPSTEPGPDPVPLAASIDTFDVIRDGFIVQIKIIYKEVPEGEGPHYSVAGTADKGTETFELQASVEPKN